MSSSYAIRTNNPRTGAITIHTEDASFKIPVHLVSREGIIKPEIINKAKDLTKENADFLVKLGIRIWPKGTIA